MAGLYDDFSFGLSGLGQAPSPTRFPLGQEESQSFSRGLLERGKSGLGAVLGALDYPGSLVRGTLAGKPGQSITGRKLLERYGVVRPGDRGWGPWGAGLAADVVTDPFTYATFGAKHALTSGGQALQKAGHLQGWNRKALLEGYNATESSLLHGGVSPELIAHRRDLGHRIASPAAESAYQAATGQALHPGSRLSGLARASVPFRPDLGVSVGSGKLAQGVAGGLDKAADVLNFGNPIGRSLGSLFDWRRQRATDAASQRAMVATTPYRKSLESQGRLEHKDTWSAIDELIRQHPQHEVHIQRAAGISAEATSPLAFLASAKDPAERAFFQDLLNRTKALGDTVAGYGSGQLEGGINQGLLTRDSKDKFSRYLHRQSTAADLAGGGPQLERRTILPTTSGSNIHRKDPFRDLPGGKDRINDWANRFAGDRSRKAVATGILNDINADHFHMTGAAPTAQEAAEYEIKAKQLAREFGRLDEKKYRGAINEKSLGPNGEFLRGPLFTHDFPGMVGERGVQHARTMASAAAAIKALAAGARRTGQFAPGEQFTVLPHAISQLGLGSHDLGTELKGAGPELYRALAPKGAGMVGPLTTRPVPAAGAKPAPYGLMKEMRNWGISNKDLAQLTRNHANWIAPEEAIKPIQVWDSVTNSFKALAYPIWLASHVRNAATAAMNNLRTGTTLSDYWNQLRLMRGTLPDSTAHSMRRSQFGHARIFDEGGQNLELAGSFSTARSTPSTRQWTGYAPGTNKYGMGKMGPTGSLVGDTANLLFNEGGLQLGRDIAAKARDWKNAPNPFGISGVGGRDRDVFAPVVAGRKLASNIEDFFRGAQYQGLLRHGYNPEMAAEQIRKFHFDYKDLTPFERHWMRRAVPFYTFTRKNLPLQAETLATRPGAFSSPFKPAMVDRDKEEYVPDYLSSGFVSPLGPETDGKRRFLSSLGLPQEEAFKELALWNGLPDWKRTAQALAGNLNPLIKGPLEQLADRQFFSGRKLSDLRPTATGRGLASLISEEYSQPVSQFVSNTPLTRFATSLDKLLDTKGVSSNGRKPGWATALNLLTGARVSDVDIEKQKYFDERNALDRMLAASPHLRQFSTFYARPEDKKLLTPDEILRLRVSEAMQTKSREYVQRQRQQTGAPQ